jgi:hypothetical protein
VAVLARALAGLEELHIGLDAALPRVHAPVHDVLDETVGGALERHVLGAHHVVARFVDLAELLRGRDVVGAEAAGLGAGMGGAFFFERGAHLESSPAQMSVGGR